MSQPPPPQDLTPTPSKEPPAICPMGQGTLCVPCCGGTLVHRPPWTRCYCFECVDALLGPGKAVQAQAQSKWACFLCLPLPGSGLLRRRTQWRARLKAFQDRESVSLVYTMLWVLPKGLGRSSRVMLVLPKIAKVLPGIMVAMPRSCSQGHGSAPQDPDGAYCGGTLGVQALISGVWYLALARVTAEPPFSEALDM